MNRINNGLPPNLQLLIVAGNHSTIANVLH
jgi:hypothetical protein